MATKTFNTAANFSALANVGIIGDAVVPAASIAASTDYHWLLKLDPYETPNGYYAKVNGINAGGYSCHQSTNGGTSYSLVNGYAHGYKIYVDGTAALTQETVNVFISPLGTNSGTNRALAQVFSSGASAGAVNRIDAYVSGYNIATSVANAVLQLRTGTTPGAGDLVAASTGKTISATGWIAFYPSLTGTALIHDSGVLHIDFGADKSADFSTATNTATATATYQYASYTSAQSWATAAEVDAGAAWNGSWLTLEQLKAEADNGNRYFYVKAQVVGSGDTSLSVLTIDDYAVDVTPPAVPSLTEFSVFSDDNYAMIWTDPTDSDFRYCELRRDVDGETKYLFNESDLPVWNTSGTYWKFCQNSLTCDSPFSNYIDEDVPGTSVSYYVRSVDNVANKSAWQAFTDSTVVSTDPGVANVKIGVEYIINDVDLTGTYNPAGTPPSVPTLTITDSEDGGTATVTIAGSDLLTENKIFASPYASTATFTEVGERIGDGTETVTLSIGKNWVYVTSLGSGGTSASAVYVVTITDGTAPTVDAFDDDFSNDDFLDAFGGEIEYIRGAETITFTAMDSTINAELLAEWGASLVTESREFVIKKTDIEELGDPARGDQIRTGHGQRYEVAKIGSAPEWENDADRNYYRVRAVLIGD